MNILAIALCIWVAAVPAARADALKASVTYLKGSARVQPAGSATVEDLVLGRELAEGDTIFSLARSRVEIRLETGQIVRVNDTATFVLRTLRQEGGAVHALFDIVSGRLWFTLVRLASGSDVAVVTKSMAVGVKGTVWRADTAEDGRTDVFVYEGTVTARPGSGPEMPVAPFEHVLAAPSVAARKSSFDEAQDERDEWVRWNKNRDRLRVSIVIRERYGDKVRTAAAAETAVIKGFLGRYLFKVLDREQADRIRATEAYKAALKGDNAAAAEAGLSVAADLVVVGEAVASSLQTPLAGHPWSARANLAARAVKCDTAEVVAAYAPESPARGFELTDEAAVHKALVVAGEKAASAFVDSILASWREEAKRGESLDVVVEGADFDGLQRMSKVLADLPGVKDVRRLYLVGRRALLGVTFAGDSTALADEIHSARFGNLGVSVVGMTAYRLELEVRARRAMIREP
jgi:hypothetical protein